MAIGDLPSSPPRAAPAQPIDIEAWTEQATAAMGSVTISAPAPVVQGTSVAFAIPLDEHDAPAQSTPLTTAQVHTVYNAIDIIWDWVAGRSISPEKRPKESSCRGVSNVAKRRRNAHSKRRSEA